MTPFRETGMQAARDGAVQGLVAWTALAAVECGLLSLAPWLLRPHYAYTPVHPGFTGLAFLAYAGVGLLLGGLTGMAAGRRGWVGPHTAVLGSFTVVVAFDANLLQEVLFGLGPFSFKQSPTHLLLPLAGSVPLLAAMVTSAASERWHARLRFLTNPWTTALLLVGLPWTTLNLLATSGTATKAIGVATVPVAVVLGSFVVARALERTVGRRSLPARLRLLLLAVVALVLLAATVPLRQTPRVAGAPPELPAGAPPRPNVLLITLDTVRADHLSVYGYARDTTPELRGFARSATLYTRAVSSGAMTLTTHGSLFTGLYGRQHGAHRSEATPAGRPLAARFETLAERLAGTGYWTTAVVANTAYLSHGFGFDQGFHHYDVRGPVILNASAPVYSPRRWLRSLLSRTLPRAAAERTYRPADAINEDAFAVLERASRRDGPFFLFLNYMDAHHPLIPPAPFDGLFPGKDPSFRSDDYYRLLRGLVRDGRPPTGEERAHLVSQYDGAIAYVDSRVGELFRKMQELDLWTNTLVVVTSDHGEALGEHSLLNHGVSVYQDQVDVPLIIKPPGAPTARTVEGLTGSVDVFATILDVAGAGVPEATSGSSLAAADPGPDRVVAAESYPWEVLVRLNPRFRRVQRAVFSGPWKLVASSDGGRELYDLEEDPAEKVNLYREDDPISRDLEARLEQWLELTVAPADSAGAAIDPEMRTRLRALGYVQ